MKIALLLGLVALVIVAFVGLQYVHVKKMHVLPVSGPVLSPPIESSPLTVSVKGKATFEVEGVLYDLAGLKQLFAQKKWDERSSLTIRRAAGALFDDTLPVIDLAREHGVARLSVE